MKMERSRGHTQHWHCNNCKDTHSPHLWVHVWVVRLSWVAMATFIWVWKDSLNASLVWWIRTVCCLVTVLLLNLQSRQFRILQKTRSKFTHNCSKSPYYLYIIPACHVLCCWFEGGDECSHLFPVEVTVSRCCWEMEGGGYLKGFQWGSPVVNIEDWGKPLYRG